MISFIFFILYCSTILSPTHGLRILVRDWNNSSSTQIDAKHDLISISLRSSYSTLGSPPLSTISFPMYIISRDEIYENCTIHVPTARNDTNLDLNEETFLDLENSHDNISNLQENNYNSQNNNSSSSEIGYDQDNTTESHDNYGDSGEGVAAGVKGAIVLMVDKVPPMHGCNRHEDGRISALARALQEMGAVALILVPHSKRVFFFSLF